MTEGITIGLLVTSALGFTLLSYIAYRFKKDLHQLHIRFQQMQQQNLHLQEQKADLSKNLDNLTEERQAWLVSSEQLKIELAQKNERLSQQANLEERIQWLTQALENSRKQEQRQQVRLQALETQNQLEREHHQQQIDLLQDTKKQLTAEFERLAQQALKENTHTFSKTHQNQITHLLQPFKEQLATFQKKVEHTYDQENRDRHSLLVEIQQLKSLNVQMSEEATNLTRALKGDNKFQGHWGEIILERVLEQSGLRKEHEYDVQKAYTDTEGKRQIPDVVVHLPEEKDIVIDSKVSLLHYEAYVSSDDESERQQAVKGFSKSLRQHLDGLSKKHYEHLPGLRTLDFVFMFIPIEAAFLLAVEQDTQLFADAYDKNIIIVSPSTLLATLRTVQSIWRYERQNRNAEQMAEVAGGIYDQCVRLIESLENLGKQLHKAQEYYDKSINQLSSGRGNLVRRVERLEHLGARVKKSMPSKYSDQAGLLSDESLSKKAGVGRSNTSKSFHEMEAVNSAHEEQTDEPS